MDSQQKKGIARRGYKLSYAYRADDTPYDYEDYAQWVQVLADRLSDGSPVPDIGCGCGLPATKALADRFVVTGVDPSEVQIGRARRLVLSLLKQERSAECGLKGKRLMADWSEAYLLKVLDV